MKKSSKPIEKIGFKSRLKNLSTLPRRRPFFTAFLVALSLLMYTPYIIIKRTYFTSHADTIPQAAAGDTAPEVQTEGFTCGVHAIHTLYLAYGLKPTEENIRKRLGVDYKTAFFISDSTGALHPDFYMILNQDGFKVNSIDLEIDDCHQQIFDHLNKGQMFILLISRPKTGNQHWVAAKAQSTESGDSSMVIYDSLEQEPYLMSADFIDKYVITALAVSPSNKKASALESANQLIEGSKELKRYYSRYKKLK